MRMDALRGALSPPSMNSPLDNSVLHGFCWATRCVAMSVVASSHIKGLPSMETLQEQFAQYLSCLCGATRELCVSNPAFKTTLDKLVQCKEYFGGRLCAQCGDVSTPDVYTCFAAICQLVQSSEDGLVEVIVSQMDALAATALTDLEKGIVASATSDSEAQASYDKVGARLRTMREAQERLLELVPQLKGKYEGTQQAICERLVRLIESVRETTEAGDASLLKQLTTHLVALLNSRSTFGLREHFDRPADGNALDELYERGLGHVVTWHQQLIQPVTDDRVSENFAERVCDHRARLEAAKCLFRLGTESATGLSAQLSEDVRGKCAELQKHVEMLVHTALKVCADKAVSEVQDLDDAKGTYLSYRQQLSILEAAAWWDVLAEEDTIGRALEAIWRAFEQRLRRLASGPDSVEAKLKGGSYETGAESLARLHEMTPLWCTGPGALSAAPGGKAGELKQLYDACLAAVLEWVGKRCQLTQTEMLAVEWSVSNPPRVDKAVWDKLKKADRFLELVKYLCTEQLEFLGLSEMSQLGTRCASRVQSELEGMRARVLELSDAIAMAPCPGQLTSERLKAAILATPADDFKEVMRVFSSSTTLSTLCTEVFTSHEDFRQQFFQTVELSFTNNLKQVLYPPASHARRPLLKLTVHAPLLRRLNASRASAWTTRTS